MRPTILFAAITVFAATARAETVVVSTPAAGGTTFYDYRNPGNPNNFHFSSGGFLEGYSDGRSYTNVRSLVVFAPPAVPVGGVLETSTLYLHVALAQVVFGYASVTVLVPEQSGPTLLDIFSGPSTYIGSSEKFGNLGGAGDNVDVLVSVDVTKYMQSAIDQQPAGAIRFILGGGSGLVDVWGPVFGPGDNSKAPLLVSKFEVVPEPSALAMGATALVVGLGVMHRRRA